jgi:3-hydroxyisobutyrate dehydrogenase-like beta-hydroxyacid dehydrogenase
MRVGFIGLGDQGGPMAEMVLEAGIDLIVWARRPAALEPWAARGAAIAGSPAELAAQSDLLCLCVTGEADVGQVLMEQGALAALRPGAMLAIHSTVRPAFCISLAEIARARGVELLDLPVSGSGHAARARSLLVMAGGEAAALDRVQPVLDAYAGRVVRMGPVGAAMSAKLINNLLAAVNIGQAFQALALGRELGVAPAQLREAVLAGTGRSFAMDALRRFQEPARAAHIRDILGKDVALALQAMPLDAAAHWRPAAEAGIAALQALAEGGPAVLDLR